MTTFLLAHNRLLCQTLARRLRAGHFSAPLVRQAPEWLISAASARLSARMVDFALLDCTDARAEPAVLLRALRARLAPARWLALLPASDPGLVRLALALGAGGCVIAPAPIERVCRAADLVRAGGQCFPRIGRVASAATSRAPLSFPSSVSSLCSMRTPSTG